MKSTVSVILRVFSVAIQLLYVKAYVHYLTVAELGYSFYLTALSSAINALLLVPADFYQQAHLTSSYSSVFPLGSVAALNQRLLFLAAALAFVLGVPVLVAGKLAPPDLLLICVLAGSTYVATSLRNFLNNRGHALFTGWMLLMEAGLKVLSFLLFLACGMSHVSAFVLSTVAAFLVETCCLAVFFYRTVPFTMTDTGDLTFRAMWDTSRAVSFSSVCNWLQLSGYRVVYVWLGFAEIAGLYAAVSNLGVMGMNSLSTVFQQIFLPQVYSSGGTYLRRYIKYGLLLCSFVLLGYLALGKVLLVVLAKRAFGPYAGLMIFGILVEAGNLFIGAGVTYFTLRRQSSRLISANVLGVLTAAAGVGLCLTWHPHDYYLLGAALVTSQVLVCAMLLYQFNQARNCEEVDA